MRWKSAVFGLALSWAAVVGCKQQCFLSECDYDHYHHIGLPPMGDCDPTASLKPMISITPDPTTILDPDRPIRYLSLAEAIAVALEQGSVGNQVQQQLGTSNDTLTSFAGGAFNIPPDSIRVLALDPAIQGAQIEGSAAKFDARWTSSLTWNTTDRPVGSPLDVFQTGNRSSLNAIQTDDASLVSSLLKPLPTGGVAGITFRNDYEITNLPARFNPTYRPSVQFQFEQPLLQGFGVEINELNVAHPGSILTPFQTASQFEGILVTRIRYDQSRAEFERVLNYMLVNVETAYWNLYAAYWNLYSREQALRQSFEAWKINRARYEAGRVPVQDFAQTRQQYELFRAQRIQALDGVLEAERQLRGLLNLPVEDGTRLVPSDQPTLSPYAPDWKTALQETLSLRPELVLVREELKFQQLNLLRTRNTLLPDLRFTSTYDTNGIGNRLDGPGPENAFRSMASNNFHNWTLGLRLDMPIGYRLQYTNVRIARLNLARTFGVVREQEQRAERFLAQQYRHMFTFYELVRAQRAQREAAAVQLEARFRLFLAGQGTLDILLEAQRVWADALRDEFTAIAQYNSAIAGFEFAKGTILRHDNVYVGEGPLPQCAQVRAVEHERERAKALVLVERANPVAAPCCFEKGELGVPHLPEHTVPPIPAVLDEKDLQHRWEELPPPHARDDAIRLPQETIPVAHFDDAPALTPALPTTTLPRTSPPAVPRTPVPPTLSPASPTTVVRPGPLSTVPPAPAGRPTVSVLPQAPARTTNDTTTPAPLRTRVETAPPVPGKTTTPAMPSVGSVYEVPPPPIPCGSPGACTTVTCDPSFSRLESLRQRFFPPKVERPTDQRNGTAAGPTGTTTAPCGDTGFQVPTAMPPAQPTTDTPPVKR